MKLRQELMFTKLEIMVIVFLVFLLPFILVQGFVIFKSAAMPDDTEYLHDAWLVSKGYLPYRDFFEHHTPLLMYTLSPLMGYIEDDFRIFEVSKFFTLLFGFASLTAVYGIARQYYGRAGSLLAATLLMTEFDFVVSSSIIRPGNFILPLWLLAVLLIIRSTRHDYDKTHLFISGLLMGVAFGFKQTSLILWAGLIVTVACHRAYIGKSSWKDILKDATLLTAGLAIPIIALSCYFLAQGALGDFIYYNVIFNLEQNQENPLFRTIELSYMLNDAPFWMLGLSSIAFSIERLKRRRLESDKIPLIVATAFAFFYSYESVSIWFYRFVPLASLMAVNGIEIVKDALKPDQTRLAKTMVFLVVFSSLANPLLNISMFQHHYAITQITRPREPNERMLKFIWNATSKDDTVFDFTGAYVFRMHAYKTWFWFDFDGKGSSSPQYDDIPQYLEKTRPKIIIYLPYFMDSFSRRNLDFINDNFQPGISDGTSIALVASKTVKPENNTANFTILSSATYDVLTEKPAGIFVDGVQANETIFLRNGDHILNTEGYIRGNVTFRLHLPT